MLVFSFDNILDHSPKGESLRERGFGKFSHLETITEKEFYLHEEVFGSAFPRLGKARDYLGELKQEDIPLLVNVFDLWKNYDTYLFLKGTHVETNKIQYILSRCSKRGNDIYARRIESRLGFLKYGGEGKFFNPLDFDGKKKVTTRLLWVTLTFDPRICSFDKAWSEIIQYEFNLWITNLRNKYGEINYVVFPQAFPNEKGKAFGYPHIHIILLFEDSKFNVWRNFEEDREGKLGFVFRIQEKQELHKQGKWRSFIDVKAISSLASLYNYAKKHFFNAGSGESKEALINNAIMWFYRKKSFSMSGYFRKKLSSYIEFISSKHNSKHFQAVLDGGLSFSIIEWEFLGCFSAKRINTVLDVGDPPFDFISLSIEEADRLLNPSLKERLGF